MCKLAKVWVFVVACLISLAAHAQVTVISGQTINQYGQPLPYTQVRVCSVTSTGVPCTPTAQIYQDYGLTIPAPNPTSADMYGNYTVYAGTLPAPNLYTVQYSPASGITWAYVVNGPFLSASGGTVTGYINALGYNGVPEADQCSGTDAWAKINTCANMLPNGGVVNAQGFGATTQTVTTPMTALATPARPIQLLLNQATIYQSNVVFSAGSIAAGTACMVPIANGSSIVTLGFSQLEGNFQLGPLAQTYDFVCNAQQDGTEQSFQIDGLSLQGNASATMAGSLLHIVKTYSGTRIQNVNTYQPFGNAVTVNGGGPYIFFNDNFADAYTGTVTYPGAVVTLNCTSHALFEGGSIQDNGLHNPLIVANNCLTSDGKTPTTGVGYQNVSPHFLDTYYEAEPATVGSFSGAPTNVDPFQFLDPWDLKMDGVTVNGLTPTGQTNLIDLLSSGSHGQNRGPVEIDGISVQAGWAGKCLVSNSAGATFVAPNLQCVVGQQDGSDSYTVAKYRWAGSGATQASSTDYEDYKNFSSMTALITNGDINAAQESGSDIGVKIANAIALCSSQCKVTVPPGNYSYSTTIVLPLNTYGTLGLSLDPGAVLTYTGSGDAIVAQINSPTITGQNQLIIEGGQLSGASAANLVHIYPSNRVTVRDMLIRGATNGNGILIEGANGVNITNNQISSNQVGVKLISTFCSGSNPPTCSQSTTGSGYAANNNRIDHNEISFNGQWGIFDDGPLAPVSGSLGNSFDHNDLELNGVGSSVYGALQIFKSVGDIIGPGNYFEGSPREVVLGQYTGGAGDYYAASGPVVFGNFFTTQPPVSPATKAYNIELENTTDALIEGNSEQGSPGLSSTTNCFLNAATGGETRTIIGRNAIFQNAIANSGNQICVNGTGVNTLAGAGSFTIFNPNYQPYVGYQSFVINTTVTSETIALQYLTANGSCWLEPSAGNTTAINNGRASYLAGTSYLSALTAGSVTLTHPSGSAMQYDVDCANSPTGGFGTP